MANQRQIGEALDSLEQDTIDQIASLTAQYKEHGINELLRQAIDTPQRHIAIVGDFMARYNESHGQNTAQPFLNECLRVYGSNKTIATINLSLSALANQAQNLVTSINGGMSYDQAADAIEVAFQKLEDLDPLDITRMPVPAGYITVWGDPW